MAASDNLHTGQFRSARGERRHKWVEDPEVKGEVGATFLMVGGRDPGVLASDSFDPKHFPNMPDEAMGVLQSGGYEAFVNKYGPLKFPGKRGTF